MKGSALKITPELRREHDLNTAAFRREKPALLRDHYGCRVAYRNGAQVAIASTLDILNEEIKTFFGSARPSCCIYHVI